MHVQIKVVHTEQRHELYIHEHKCLCCVSTVTSSVVQIRDVSQRIQLYIQGHMLCTHGLTCIRCLNEDSIAYLTTEI